MTENEEVHRCENCKFSDFADKYKKGAFEGMCQNQRIAANGPYPGFPHIRRQGKCGFWQPEQ